MHTEFEIRTVEAGIPPTLIMGSKVAGKRTTIWVYPMSIKRVNPRVALSLSTSPRPQAESFILIGNPPHLQKNGVLTVMPKKPVSSDQVSATTASYLQFDFSLPFTLFWWLVFTFDFLFIIGDDSASRKRFQRVEILKIAEPCPLIDPSQVVVSQGQIMVADPVLTPIGKTCKSKEQLKAHFRTLVHNFPARFTKKP